jgi:hypothetical protein
MKLIYFAVLAAAGAEQVASSPTCPAEACQSPRRQADRQTV